MIQTYDNYSALEQSGLYGLESYKFPYSTMG